MRTITIALAMLALAASAHSASYDLNELEELFGNTTDAGGTYSFSHVTYEADGSTISSRGTLKFLKPDKYDAMYTEPQDYEVVSNGETIWVYDPTLRQVIITAADRAKTAKGFLSVLANGGQDEALTRRVEQDDGENRSWLVLVPDNPDDYQFLECRISFDEFGRIEEIRLINLIGSEIHAKFDIVTAGEVYPADFDFKVPSGTEVIHQ